MKRLLLGVVIFGGAALLGGCPIYPDNHSYQVCNDCCTSADCGPGSSCSPQGFCVADSDASTSSGPCGICAAGTECTLAGGVAQCLPVGEVDDASVAVDSSTSITPVPEDAGTVTGDAAPDSAGNSDGGSSGIACNGDSECGGGAKCIDGLCTAPNQLCSDGTQCISPGDACVDGVCVPTCGTSAALCPTGYQCDFNRGVCLVNPSPCSSSAQCQGGAVCVDTRCVAPCASGDTGSQCAAGLVCVNGGCIPEQQARFTCISGVNGACDPGSICLRGDCYPTCDADGGGCTAPGAVCKSVTVEKVPFRACGTASNLGNECDPAAGNLCDTASTVCIDGYCIGLDGGAR
jgi:hypothetical protein